MIPEPADADCALCQAPVVVVTMRDGACELLDAEHAGSKLQHVVLNQHGTGLRVSRVYTEHSATCGAKRKTS